MTQSTILEDILLVEGQNRKQENLGHEILVISLFFQEYENLLQNFYCVIIRWNIDIGIEYFLEKILNFDIFYRDNKSWVPFEFCPC